jgi:hypothetical protein
MHQKGRQLPGIGTIMAQLNQPDRPIAAAVQVGGEVAQDSIGVLIAFIDEGGKIALRVDMRCLLRGLSSGGIEDGHLEIAGHHFPVDEKVVITHRLCSPCRTDLVSGLVIF